MAMASLVLTWSRPKVKEKRRASSLIPQNADEERSNPWPRSDSISLKSWVGRERCGGGGGAIRSVISFRIGRHIVESQQGGQCTDLLQTENERLGALDLVDLPSFTHRLLDDVAVIVVILQKEERRKLKET